MTREAESKKVSIEKPKNSCKDQKLDTQNPGILSDFITRSIRKFQTGASKSTLSFF